MANRLANSASPYLLQHKDNPVDWWEWGEQAFAEARRRDVPVLLSVGYAACHWCHVMARESFEDEQTAALMNQRFVNVKVDREERPDVDSIYMQSVQAMSGHGGWPMTVWMDHEGKPFFAGTYFPKAQRQGMASFTQVIEATSDAWTTRRDEVAEQSSRLVEAITQELPVGNSATAETLSAAYESIAATFEPIHGGFGGAPKFPQQPVLEFLLRTHDEAWAPNARHMVEHTLEQMRRGGINDHLGGGFSRYSVDSRWRVPHFEKMLYDNAQLSRLFLWAGVEFDNKDFITTARRTLDYLLTDLRDSRGGFYSSADADSEGEEGKFYVWSETEIRAELGDAADDFIEYFGVTAAGNFEGSNILSIVGEQPPPDLNDSVERLFSIRATRVRPGLDDKVVASWNGLAIRAFAEAGAALGEAVYLEAAVRAAEFVLEEMRTADTIHRAWRRGVLSVPGFLDDYAAMAVGLFALYAATGDVRRYEAAQRLVARFDQFTNPAGGFYSTSETSETLIKRPADITDNPSPSGNALAAEALMLSALYTGSAVAMETATQALAAVGWYMDRAPGGVGHHLAVSHSQMNGRELAIAGPEWEPLAAVYWQRFRPHIVMAVSPDPTDRVPLLERRHAEGETLAYVCRGLVCDLPTASQTELETLLQ